MINTNDVAGILTACIVFRSLQVGLGIARKLGEC
jgi:adenine/guanine phosphoribosyltransferase-like PRPP-binding protein